MKKQIITVIGLTTLLVNQSYGQFSATPGLLTTPQSIGANVGIGTGSPNAKLEILSTTNQFRLSNTSSIFNDINTNASGYLTIMPSNATTSRIGFNTNAPVVGLHVNMGTFRLTDPDPSASTRAFQVSASYPGNGDIPAGTLVSSTSSASSPDGLSFIPSAQGAIGSKLGAYAYSQYGGGWKSMWETQNIDWVRQVPNLLLVKNGGNIGIGTGATLPTSHLHMVSGALGTAGGTKVQWVNFSGDVGTGNIDQLKIFNQRITGGGSNWNSSEIKIQRAVGTVDMSFISFRSTDPTWGMSAIVFGSGTTDHMKIDYLGRVAIGTQTMSGTHSDALLTVAGKMVAQSCYITMTGWADYVFAKDYKVPNLYDVEAYYKANKHLPEIPSEKEIIENGVNVADMNKLLLKKIEEMTILMVQQQKDIDVLKTKIK